MTDLITITDFKLDQWEEIVKLQNKGLTEGAIGKQLGIPRKEVVALQREYREMLFNNPEAKALAVELLDRMIKHYDELIADHYEVIDKIRRQTFDDKYSNQELKALKQIAELVAARLDAVNKAGLLENTELNDELGEMQEKAGILIDILRHDLCPACKKEVAYKLQKVTGTVESVRVDNG